MEHPCPICGSPAEQDRSNRYRPFCSSRCKMVDLDRWLSGDYRIEGPAGSDDAPRRSGTDTGDGFEIPDDRDA